MVGDVNIQMPGDSSEAWYLWKHILLMRSLKLFTHMYTQHHLLNDDMIPNFKVGNVGLISARTLCFHFTQGFHFVVMTETVKD